jgi:transposase
VRGRDRQCGELFSYVGVETRLRSDHPLRAIRVLVDEALAVLSPSFSAIYDERTGRPSIPPERLLRAMLLQAFYSVRSERQLMERLEFDLLFRWFVGLTADEPAWDASTFSKNRERLLGGQIAAKFFAAVLDNPRVKRLLSTEHFSVDGTLIDAWAGMRSFQPKEDGHGGRSGRRNGDFRGDRRLNSTHGSTTDADARLYRKGKGKPAQLCYMGHVLMENRNGLAVGTHLTLASGTAEREAALAMVDQAQLSPGATLGADKAYHAWRFRQALRERGYAPHTALRSDTGWGGARIVPPAGYGVSQRVRKRIEEIFGWVKTVAGQAKTKFRGRSRVAQGFQLAVAAYNLIRIPKLLMPERLARQTAAAA